MIVSDDNEDRQKQDKYEGPTVRVRVPERVARRRRSWSPLPDYEASEAQHRQSLALDRKKTWHQTKVWRGILFLLLAYALLTTAIGVPIIVTRLRNNNKDPSSTFTSLVANQFPSPGAITLQDDMICNKWDDVDYVKDAKPYKATLNLQLPATGDISIRSNSTFESVQPNVNGNITVNYDSNLKSNDTQLSVVLQTSTRPLQDSTLICYSETGPNRGLSLFFPGKMTQIESISVDIYITFPRAASTPSSIPNFNVYLPFFTQMFHDLTKVDFQTVNIEGGIGSIDLANIEAPRISVKSMLGDISGTFSASESLVLDTIRGGINTSITLVKPSTRASPTTLILDTGDREIDAKVYLVSSSKTPGPPHFWGKVNTFSAPINLTINQDDSVPSIPIYFQVQDNLGSPTVVLDQKFEGTFFAQTKMAAVTVLQGEDNPKFDPMGTGAPRNLNFDEGSSSSITSGWIGWGKEPASGGQSHIEVISSLVPVQLQFGPT